LEQIESQICIFVASQGDVSSSDIGKQFPEIPRRSMFRYLKKLRENGDLNYGRIHGNGTKWSRYSIPEEERIKNDIWGWEISEKHDKKNPRRINIKITQRQLSQIITKDKKNYKMKLNKLKKESYEEFIFYHLAIASHCMEWILQLTWAINADVFSKSPNKLNRAKGNKDRYEKFLHKIIYNLRIKDEKRFKSISATVYNLLNHTSIMDTLFPDTKFDFAIPKAKSLH